MQDIDELLEHLFSNIDDENVSLTKRMREGSSVYYLNIKLDTGDNTSKNCSSYDDFSIVVDSRSNCLDIFSNIDNIVVESEELCKKWSKVFDDYLSKNLSERLQKMLTDTFSNSPQKSLLRGYKLKKIDI